MKNPLNFAVVVHILSTRVYCQSSIQSCIARYQTTDGITVLKQFAQEDDQTSAFVLYKSERALTWCDSHSLCQSLGNRLATAQNKVTQELWTSNIPQNVSSVWVSARRKDFGTNWTWISDSLLPANIEQGRCFEQNEPAKPFCRVIITANTFVVREGVDRLKRYICSSGGAQSSSRELTWYEAMNACADNVPGSRLAVYNDVVNYQKKSELPVKTNSYWVGVYYRPWIWVRTDNNTVRPDPVYYSSWRMSSDAEMYSNGCLALNGSERGRWVALPCDHNLNYFLCEHTPDVTTTQETPSTKNIHKESHSSEINTEVDGRNESTISGLAYTTVSPPSEEIPFLWIVIVCSVVGASFIFLFMAVTLFLCVRSNKRAKSQIILTTPLEHNTGSDVRPLEQDRSYLHLLECSLGSDAGPTDRGSYLQPLEYRTGLYEDPTDPDRTDSSSIYTEIRESAVYNKLRKIQPDLPPRHPAPEQDKGTEAVEQNPKTLTSTEVTGGVNIGTSGIEERTLPDGLVADELNQSSAVLKDGLFYGNCEKDNYESTE